MAKVALVRRNGEVAVYERQIDAYWGRVVYVPDPDIETIDPQPVRRGMIIGPVGMLAISVLVAALLW